MLDQILAYNTKFVESKAYEEYRTTRFPDKKIVVFSCMDTRLTELLPRAMNLRNGDAKFVKNAGALITHPFGSVMRSIIVAVYELHAQEIYVVGHYGCGMASINPTETVKKMISSGVAQETLSILRYSGIDVFRWLHGFDCVEESVKASVETIQNHPLLPNSIIVHGLVMDPETGKLSLIVDGSKTR